MSSLINLITNIILSLYEFTVTIGIPSYALAITLMTIFLKLILYPLSVKQMKSMKNMQMIQPKMEQLQKKYKNDKEKLNAAVMDLYKKYNVNPMAGCLPVLVQLPILLSLFRALRDFTFEPLEHATFFWISNLSNPDPYYILPVLVGAATFLQSKFTTPTGAGGQQAMMLYFMPLMMGWVSMQFPAGLCLYWVVFNTLGVVQQVIINRQPLAEKGEVSGK